MGYQNHESVPPASNPVIAVSLPEADLLSLINNTEDLERSLAALRGAAYGIHHSIDQQTIRGEEVESLLVLISQQLDQHAARITEGVIALTHQRRSTDRRSAP